MSFASLRWPLLLLLICAAGCGSKPPKRTIPQIQQDLENLPALFLTDKTEREVFAPAKIGLVFVDKDSGEIAWLAFTCTNPKCPSKDAGRNGRPFLFPWRDPTARIEADGTVSLRNIPPDRAAHLREYLESLGGHAEATCPACLKLRDPKSETDSQRQHYADFVQPYVPPEATKRMQELTEELAALKESLIERSKRKANKDTE